MASATRIAIGQAVSKPALQLLCALGIARKRFNELINFIGMRWYVKRRVQKILPAPDFPAPVERITDAV